MESLSIGDLKIEVMEVDTPPELRMHWLGKSNDRQPSKTLGPFFAIALAHAASRGAALTLHFEKLDHFNSSTITSMIQLIQEARSSKTRLAFVFDPTRKWQKLSFDALRVFVKADDLFELRPVSK